MRITVHGHMIVLYAYFLLKPRALSYNFVELSLVWDWVTKQSQTRIKYIPKDKTGVAQVLSLTTAGKTYSNLMHWHYHMDQFHGAGFS